MPIEPIDGAGERRSPDDEAQFTTERLLAAALQEQQRRARLAPRAVQGVCSNCGERCLPTAVYCDAECREDHEARERKRMRGAAG